MQLYQQLLATRLLFIKAINFSEIFENNSFQYSFRVE